jgi:hypothetical protein
MLSFDFDNRWSRFIQLAPYTSFTVSIFLAEGKVNGLTLLMGNGGVEGARVYVREVSGELKTPPYGADAKQVGPPWHLTMISVRLTSHATATQRKRALAFNLSCLSKFRGCKYSEDMLPECHLILPRKLVKLNHTFDR